MIHVPYIRLFGVKIAELTLNETLEVMRQAILGRKQIHHSVVNAGKIVLMQKNQELSKSVVSADLINADGMAVVWAAKICGKPLPERVTGIDLMIQMVKMAHDNDYKCYFLGAKTEVVEKVVDIYSSQYSPDVVAGYHNGYFDENEYIDIATQIASSGANMLFVAITSPKKEIFLDCTKHILRNVNVIMGVGGSFDVVAGKVKRAPIWMQNSGLEWFYRFIQEPQRMWKRYIIGNLKFLSLTIKEMSSKREKVLPL